MKKVLIVVILFVIIGIVVTIAILNHVESLKSTMRSLQEGNSEKIYALSDKVDQLSSDTNRVTRDDIRRLNEAIEMFEKRAAETPIQKLLESFSDERRVIRLHKAGCKGGDECRCYPIFAPEPIFVQ